MPPEKPRKFCQLFSNNYKRYLLAVILCSLYEILCVKIYVFIGYYLGYGWV